MSYAQNYQAGDFAMESDVSRETFESFQKWEKLLIRWNAKINLVSRTALSEFWRRHALDSWQLANKLPTGDIRVLDLGSGAGFPGVALAIALKARGEGHVTLVESAGKKNNFLRTIIRDLALPACAISERAEALDAKIYDVISARAFAPMPRLLTYAQPFWGPSTIGLFLKGISVEQELTEARKYWTFQQEIDPSRSDETGVILMISGLCRLENQLEP